MVGIHQNFNKIQFKSVKKKINNKNQNYQSIVKKNKMKKQKKKHQKKQSTHQIQMNPSQKANTQ